MNYLKEIFKDHFKELEALNPRPSIIENVIKMINCGEHENGGTMYSCDKCGNMKFVPFRCHSRFCPTCGVKYCQARSLNMSFKIINANHRHCVFTIDKDLRHFFAEDRSLLNCLFDAVNSVVTRMFHKENKSECFTPGFICVLHTFGRDLKWNPHIHCLISEGGIGKSNKWRNRKFFSFNFLRHAFLTALLDILETKIGPSFKKVKASNYKIHKDGFYVFAKPNECEPKNVIKYIGRYLGRPVIANSRIDSYDGNFVRFHYNRHEDDAYVEESISAMSFIKRLIRHIPEKNFKMIRYYGIYAKHNYENDSSINHPITKEKRSVYSSFLKWRSNIFFSFGIDPLKCPDCGSNMSVLEFIVNKKHFTLRDLISNCMMNPRYLHHLNSS